MNTVMTDLSLLFLKGFLAFVSTNVDDLLLLILLIRENDSRINRKNVIFSQYLSFLIMIALSILGSLCKFILPLNIIGLLGLVPIIYGIRKLLPGRSFHTANPNFNFFTMTTLALGDGLDNISTYTALFASETLPHICILSGYFLLLLAPWCYVGIALARTSVMSLFTRKIAQTIPFIYICLGLFIMHENKTMELFR